MNGNIILFISLLGAVYFVQCFPINDGSSNMDVYNYMDDTSNMVLNEGIYKFLCDQ